MIQPIETTYSGYRFRSRLEARWAVFFDALGLPWEFEPEGFNLEGGVWYLPDFWLPTHETWVEIKPFVAGATISADAEQKAQALAVASGHRVAVLVGPPAITPPEWAHLVCDGGFDDGHGGSTWAWDTEYRWCECPRCPQIGLQFHGRAERLDCGCLDGQEEVSGDDTTRLRSAVTAALSARFGT